MSSEDIFTQNNDNIEIITFPGNQVELIETNVVLVPEQQQLLIHWGCEELLSDFIEKGIDVECFKEMTELDIQNLIPSAKYGLRIKFRSRLLNWRKENGFPLIALSDAISMGSSVPTWISSSSFSENLESSPTSSLQSLFEIQPSGITLTDNKTKTLEQILQTSIVGKSILDISKKNETLSFKSRNDLCDLIAHFWIINDFEHVLSSQYCRELVDSILKLFPIEDKEYYISTNKKRKGKLAEKYYSLLRKYREKGVIESRYMLKRQKTNHTSNSENIENPEKDQETEDTEIFEKEIGNQLWLKSNKQPEALVVEKWRSTFDLRLKHIRDEKDIFFEWPILKQQIGISLIEVDFDKLYPNKSQLLFSKWDEFKTKINNIYKKNIKDSTSNIILILWLLEQILILKSIYTRISKLITKINEFQETKQRRISPRMY